MQGAQRMPTFRETVLHARLPLQEMEKGRLLNVHLQIFNEPSREFITFLTPARKDEDTPE